MKTLRTRRALRGAFLLTALTFGTIACQWAPAPVPADPGLNAQLRDGPEAAFVPTSTTPASMQDPDPQAGRLYAQYCARCHDLIAPASYGADAWPRYVRRYAPRAGLYGADRTRVLGWLQRHAAR